MRIYGNLRYSSLCAVCAIVWTIPAVAQKDSKDTINSIKSKKPVSTTNASKSAIGRVSKSTKTPTKTTRTTTKPVKLPASPPQIVVAKLGGGQFRTIGEAIQKAKPGTRILVRAGIYAESLVVDKPIEIVADPDAALGDVIVESRRAPAILMTAEQALVRGLALRPPAGDERGSVTMVDIVAGRSILDGCSIDSGSKSCVDVRGSAANPQLKGCQLRGDRIAAVHVTDSSQASLDNCRVEGASSQGLYADGAKITVHGGYVRGAKESGIWLTNGATGIVEASEISKSGYTGIWVNKASKLTIRQSTVSDSAEWHGIGLADGSQGTIEDCEISNIAKNGIEIGGKVSVRRCRIHDVWTGIVLDTKMEAAFEKCEVWNTKGAGFYVTHGSSPAIRGCNVHDTGWDGIMFLPDATGLVDDCDISTSVDAGISVNRGNPTLRNCRIRNSKKIGIWILFPGQSTIEDCEVYDSASNGIEISDGAEPFVKKCRIRDSKGNGIFIRANARATIDDCDVTGSVYAGISFLQGKGTVVNCRVTGGGGPAIWANSGSQASIESSTLVPNKQGPSYVEKGGRVGFVRNVGQ